MKKLKTNKHWLLLMLLCYACSVQPHQEYARDQFDFLIGNWIRTNEQAGRMTFENWEKTDDGTYQGIGFTLEGSDTLSREEMVLQKQQERWLFIVSIRGLENPVPFSLTEITDSSFTCVNDTNDFPNRINYFKEGGMLKAEVSSVDFTIDFIFENRN